MYCLFHRNTGDEIPRPYLLNTDHLVAVTEDGPDDSGTKLYLSHGPVVTLYEDMETVLTQIGFLNEGGR